MVYYLTDSIPIPNSQFGSGTGPIIFDRVSCDGSESNVLDCQSNVGHHHSCSHTDDASVACTGKWRSSARTHLYISRAFTFSLLDVNECLVNNGNCSDICVNDIPYHHCECNEGDELDLTGFICIHNVECSGRGVNCSCRSGYEDLSGEAANCTGKYRLRCMYTHSRNYHFSFLCVY